MAEETKDKEQLEVTDSDLQKSIETLTSLLEAEPGEELENEDEEVVSKGGKMKVGTQGGLYKKAKGEDIDDEPDQDEEEEDEDDADDDEDVEKSLAKSFADYDELAEATVSGDDFTKSLVLGTLEGLDITVKTLQKAIRSESRRNDSLVKSLAKSVLEVAKAVESIKGTMDAVANQPSRTASKSVKYLGKSFNTAPASDTLSKSQIVDRLMKLANEKKIDPMVVVRYETSDELPDALMAELAAQA